MKHNIIGLHLDFKYHMYNKEFLKNLPDWLKHNGINTLLLEYEDKFPYRKYAFLRAENAFSPSELKDFLKDIRTAGLQIIPLVQSLSHFEFALAHEELAHLRESADTPTMICPENPEALEFVFDLMAEVMEYHKEDEFFHCGGDEAWALCSCEKCKKAALNKDGKIGLWVHHQNKIIDFMIKNNKRPILWDDIFWENPEAAISSDLDRRVILNAWNYGITELNVNPNKNVDLEFGGNDITLSQVDKYIAAGFDCIGSPCINYGQLFPRFHESVENTRVWLQKMHNSDMLGIINTSWAVFHIPLQIQKLYFSITGSFACNTDVKIDNAYIEKWFNKEFGIPVPGIKDAMEAFGALWEIPMTGYGRSFTPIIYCYMNMVLHYKNGQSERKKRGAYPLNWTGIDFTEIYQKGLAAVKNDDCSKIITEAEKIILQYKNNIHTMKFLAENAEINISEANIYYIFAKLKLCAAQIFHYLLIGENNSTINEKHNLQLEINKLEPELYEVLQHCFEQCGCEKMINAWLKPLQEAMK